jgi:hypothetical protein
MSTVTFAGFSRVNGVLKFRTANDTKRIDQLRKLGDTDVVILALDSVMSKNAAAKFVLTNLASGAYMVDTVEAESVLTNLIKDENPFAKPAKTVAKTPQKVVAKKPQTVVAKNVTIKPVTAPVMEFSTAQADKIRAQFMKKLLQNG